jgi:hypothetical protein
VGIRPAQFPLASLRFSNQIESPGRVITKTVRVMFVILSLPALAGGGCAITKNKVLSLLVLYRLTIFRYPDLRDPGIQRKFRSGRC